MEIDLISPSKIKGRVNPFTKTNMALRFPTLNVQHNQCESGALYHAEQFNGQNDRIHLATKKKDKTLGQLLDFDEKGRWANTRTYPGLFSQPG
jgi:hypothetical protein